MNIKDIVIEWVKRVVGEGLSSKKTLATGGAIVTIVAFVSKVNSALAIICATICFVAWIFAQAYVDGKKIEKDAK